MVCHKTTENFDMLDYVSVCIKSLIPHRFRSKGDYHLNPSVHWSSQKTRDCCLERFQLSFTPHKKMAMPRCLSE